MQNEYVSPVREQNADALPSSKIFSLCSVIGRSLADKKPGLPFSIARFVLLVVVYSSAFIAILGSLDSAQHAHNALGINFAYKVF